MTATLVGGKIIVSATVEPQQIRKPYVVLTVTTDNKTTVMHGPGKKISLDPFENQAIAKGEIGYPTEGEDRYINCTPNPIVMPAVPAN